MRERLEHKEYYQAMRKLKPVFNGESIVSKISNTGMNMEGEKPHTGITKAQG